MNSEIDWKVECAVNHEDEIITAHSCGLKKYCGKELEIVLTMPPVVSCIVINELGLKIKKAEIVMGDGITIPAFLKNNSDLLIKEFTAIYGEPGEKAYRLIFPDSNGLFPDNKNCSKFFKIQFKEFKYYDVKR